MLSVSLNVVRVVLVLLATLLFQWPASVLAAGTQPSGAAGLRTRHAALQPMLANSPFGGPLVLESTEGSGTLQGDVYAVVEHPFGAVSFAFGDPAHWCDVLILHLNTKYCRRNIEGGASQIEVRVGKKFDQPISAATRVAFAFHVVSATPEYLAVALKAPDGPFDTNDYSILLEAVPLDTGRTFIHMGYSFDYGAISRMAMRVYLGTIASDKVGFTTSAKSQPGEAPQYIGGMRGLVERNTMRYYLAIDAYLGAISTPPGDQLEKRLRDWFDGTERYAKQLHEIDRVAYLTMKRHEYQRQQLPQ
jgi:hypothetical protein